MLHTMYSQREGREEEVAMVFSLDNLAMVANTEQAIRIVISPMTSYQNVFIEDKTMKDLAYQDLLNKWTEHLRIKESK